MKAFACPADRVLEEVFYSACIVESGLLSLGVVVVRLVNGGWIGPQSIKRDSCSTGRRPRNLARVTFTRSVRMRQHEVQRSNA